MEVLKTKITIGPYTFDYVHRLAFESSWEEQTSKGSVLFPSKLKLDRGNLKSEFKKGTPIKIESGYESNFGVVFEGYVTRVVPSVPVEIMFEDEMYQLKKIEVNEVAKNETLKSFLSRVIPGYEIDCPDTFISKFIAINNTAAQLLEQLQEDHYGNSFFRKKKLIVGKPYDTLNYKVHIIELNYNVLQDSLEYMEKGDYKLKIIGIANMNDGSKREVEVGESGGASETRQFGETSLKDLKELCENEYKKALFDGYRGSITIFGTPFVQHGDLIELRNKEESDKTGRYWVDAVTYEHGINGTRQTLKLGARHDDQRSN